MTFTVQWSSVGTTIHYKDTLCGQLTGGWMLTGWCSLHIWQFQREQRQQMHSIGEGGTCPRWWRSSCTCWLPQSAAASSVLPLIITHRQSEAYFAATKHNLFRKITLTITNEYVLAQKYTYMLPTYRKESEDDHTGAHHVGICILEGVWWWVICVHWSIVPLNV